VEPILKPLLWIGTTLEDLKDFPEEVKQVMGYALHLAQVGGKHPDAKPLKGFGGAGVLEVVDDFDGDTFRAVYTVKLAGEVYALHAFQKKSRKGIKTSQADLEKVKKRLKLAEEIHAVRIARAEQRKKEESDEEK
jgi:phage-related protein